MNRLQTSNFTILDNDKYFSGVYRQKTFRTVDNITDYHYIKNVPCPLVFSDTANLTDSSSEYLKSTLPVMNCADTSTLKIQGSNSLDETPLQTDSNTFEFVVMDCQNMNLIREQLFKEEPVDCAS